MMKYHFYGLIMSSGRVNLTIIWVGLPDHTIPSKQRAPTTSSRWGSLRFQAREFQYAVAGFEDEGGHLWMNEVSL